MGSVKKKYIIVIFLFVLLFLTIMVLYLHSIYVGRAQAAVISRDITRLHRSLSTADGIAAANAKKLASLLPRDKPSTAICLAAKYNWVDGVELLLSSGVDPLATDADRLTPMDLGIMMRSRDALKVLIEHGVPSGRYSSVLYFIASEEDLELALAADRQGLWRGFKFIPEIRDALSKTEQGKKIIEIVERANENSSGK
jgi:ankyrin repeat protein